MHVSFIDTRPPRTPRDAFAIFAALIQSLQCNMALKWRTCTYVHIVLENKAHTVHP